MGRTVGDRQGGDWTSACWYPAWVSWRTRQEQAWEDATSHLFTPHLERDRRLNPLRRADTQGMPRLLPASATHGQTFQPQGLGWCLWPGDILKSRSLSVFPGRLTRSPKECRSSFVITSVRYSGSRDSHPRVSLLLSGALGFLEALGSQVNTTQDRGPRSSHWLYLWLIQVDSELGFRGHWGRLSCAWLVSPPPRVWIHLGWGPDLLLLFFF